MSITGPAAASAAASVGQRLVQSARRRTRPPSRASSSSRLAARPANVAEALVVADTEQLHDPGRDGVAARRHGDPPAVGAAVRARGARCTAARRRGAAAARRVSAYTDGSGPISWNIVSSRLMSTTWPRPLCRATIVANAAASPVASSVRAIGGSSGWPSGSPLIADSPDIASAIVANPGRSAYGPSWPKPDTRVTTRRGLRACSTSGPRPRRSSAPGPEVLDEHVGVVGEAQHQLEAGRVLEVDDDRALVAVGQLPPQPLAVALVAPRHVAQAVAAGALDLDHVGAEVGEVAGAVGPGDDRRQVERRGRSASGTASCCHETASMMMRLVGAGAELGGVAAVEGEQLVVRAELDDAPAVEHGDAVGVADRRQAVGDDERGAAEQGASRVPPGPGSRCRCRGGSSPRRGSSPPGP